METALGPLGGVEAPSLKDFCKWVKTAFTISYQQEIEQYLASSVDIAELDYRIKVLKYRGML